MKLTANDYIKATKRIEKSAAWKYQTQQYVLNRLTEISKLKKAVDHGTYQPGKPNEFILCEQGRRRLIKALPIQDMVLQHAVVNTIILPTLKPYLIHDNGAGIKGKGISFTRRRFEQHLHWFYRRHAWNGYALTIDFRKYFDNIDHDIMLDMLERKIKDKEVMNLLRKIFRSYRVDISFDPDLKNKIFNSLDYYRIPKSELTGKAYMHKSLGIGAPISQILGVFYPTPIDMWCKTVRGIHCYDAYMDDRIILHPSKLYLEKLFKEIIDIAGRLGIHVNYHKTQIIKLSHGFTWLKTRYILAPSGKIIKKIPRDVVTRERRKMKALARAGKYDILKEQYKSWRGDKKRYNAFHTIRNLDKLYKELIADGRKRNETANYQPGHHHSRK